MMKGPYFSIIVPVYNVKPYLQECLGSLLKQTYSNWECVCVDDGSQDGSGFLLDDVARIDSRFRVIHQPNGGVSQARNRALQGIRGEIISFLDGDDAITPNWLMVANRVLGATSCDAVSLWLQRWDGGTVELEPKEGELLSFRGEEEILSSLWDKLAGYIWVWFFRKSILRGIRFPVGVRVAEDLLCLLESSIGWHSYAKMIYRGYLYRNRAGSAVLVRQTCEEQLLFMENLLRVWQKTVQTYPEVVAWPNARGGASRSLQVHLLECLGYGTRKERVRCLNIYHSARMAGLLCDGGISLSWRSLFVMLRWFRIVFPFQWACSFVSWKQRKAKK